MKRILYQARIKLTSGFTDWSNCPKALHDDVASKPELCPNMEVRNVVVELSLPKILCEPCKYYQI